MVTARGIVRRGGLDGKGRPRKLVEIRDIFYDDFEFGDPVNIDPVDNDKTKTEKKAEDPSSARSHAPSQK